MPYSVYSKDQLVPKTPYPYWLTIVGNVRDEQYVKRVLGELFGTGGSSIPGLGECWGSKQVNGHLTLMFRTTDDRALARLRI